MRKEIQWVLMDLFFLILLLVSHILAISCHVNLLFYMSLKGLQLLLGCCCAATATCVLKIYYGPVFRRPFYMSLKVLIFLSVNMRCSTCVLLTKLNDFATHGQFHIPHNQKCQTLAAAKPYLMLSLWFGY
ncbi:uncharacterized protein [Rutidosis leptorrhynchoides]|uniref:uncharacterized protein n=1 Tax=Rutidosis leptorrhynchoides TaxID=125765 RepID=UPI003A98EA4B